MKTNSPPGTGFIAKPMSLGNPKLAAAILTVGVIVGFGLLLPGLVSSYDSPDPATASAKKPDITILYTENNVGYIEPCG